MKTRRPSEKQLAFARWLAGLVEKGDRGTLAALRRGLMYEEEQLYGLYAQIPPNFLAGLDEYGARRYLMVAALFASHPESYTPAEEDGPRRNLGDALRELATRKATPGTAPGDLLTDPLKRRMEVVLAAPRDELFGHLQQIVGLLRSEKIRIDWAQLLQHLEMWTLPKRPVQWSWSRSFYVGQYEQEGE